MTSVIIYNFIRQTMTENKKKRKVIYLLNESVDFK